MMGDVMRRLRLISCLIVGMLCCSLLAPVASAASTFAADLDLYRTNNKTTSDAASELETYVTTELLFARSLKRTAPQSPLLVRTYLIVLDQVDSVTRRIVRDQHVSDCLLADVLALASEKRIEAAWILLKRGTAGQERFLSTITQTRLLVARCKLLHAQLTRMGG
jgi:uncharacterized membrane-anchored protein